MRTALKSTTYISLQLVVPLEGATHRGGCSTMELLVHLVLPDRT